MINAHLICTIAAESGQDKAMLLEYTVWEHKTDGFWSISIYKREHSNGRAVELEHAAAACGRARRADVMGFARGLASRAVTPAALDGAVSDFLALTLPR